MLSGSCVFFGVFGQRPGPRAFFLGGTICALLFFWALVLPALAEKAPAESLRIGVMAPLTGKLAAEGEDARRLLQLQARLWNASGKLGKAELLLDFQDDAGDPRTAALAAQKLIARGAVAIISAYGSSVTEAAQQLIHEAGLVHLSSGATSVRLTEKGLPRFFRMGPRDDAQSRKAVERLQSLGVRRVALVHDNSSHPRGFAEEIYVLLTKSPEDSPSAAKMPEVVFYDALPPGQRDYSAVLQKIRQTKPDLLLYTGYYPETALLLRQRSEMHWALPMLGGDASNHQDLVHMAGLASARGYLFLSAPMPQYLASPEATAFMQAYVAHYGAWPLSVWSALAGDGLNLVASALAQNIRQPAAMGDYLHRLGSGAAGGLAPYAGLTGPVSFDAKGDRTGELYKLYQVDDAGHFVPYGE